MKYFTIQEFEVSRTAAAAGERLVVPTKYHENIRRLVGLVLDPLREAIGRPIYITSGYRNKWLNAQVGGEEKSYHLQGMAADITTRDNRGNVKMLAALLELRLPYTELGIYMNQYGAIVRLHLALDPDFAIRRIFYRGS